MTIVDRALHLHFSSEKTIWFSSRRKQSNSRLVPEKWRDLFNFVQRPLSLSHQNFIIIAPPLIISEIQNLLLKKIQRHSSDHVLVQCLMEDGGHGTKSKAYCIHNGLQMFFQLYGGKPLVAHGTKEKKRSFCVKRKKVRRHQLWHTNEFRARRRKKCFVSFLVAVACLWLSATSACAFPCYSLLLICIHLSSPTIAFFIFRRVSARSMCRSMDS